ncbi:MAG: acyl-CoA synthetase [Xanthomonadales bacterium]|nr:acyl-CoA synthetase [Xanthomonadales bacterium]ODU92011.1 MAG: AMP-ligase [Rhodanobacter sp. SCN 66-43]OJY84933.1 MAG: AMP-ligase [Xanthomonadales bacterium 66-474]
MSSVYEPQRGAVAGPWWPLLADASPQRVVVWRDGQAVHATSFLADVESLAARLPVAQAAVNLCEDRYAFLVAFAALLVRGQINLLPPSRAAHAIDAALRAHPDSYTLGDAPLYPEPPDFLHFVPDGRGHPVAPMLVAGNATAAIGYTSGSTGVPRANPKCWERLAVSSGHNDALLRALAGGDYHVVATVPPQHMYGLEFSVLLPLFGHASVCAGKPFFAADIAASLQQLPEPRILVTTPVHLRALLDSGHPLPRLSGIVSATAPLSRELAHDAEARFGAPVQEVFGSTETCVIAHRRTAHEDAWTPYPGISLHPQPDGTRIEAPQLLQPVVLADVVELPGDGRFRLCGRNTDLLEIAGKRASLGDLTHKLLAVPGVRDGVVFQVDDVDNMGVRRIAALAVAPGLDARTILDALRADIDQVFLPRPLKLVDALPRSETGKLPRVALLAALNR